MIILKHQYTGKVWIVAGIIIVLSILIFERESIEKDFFNEYPVTEFGYSSKQQFVNQCSRNCLSTIFRGFIHTITTTFSSSTTSQIELHIPFKNMQQIKADQLASIQKGRLIQNPHWVKASINYQGKLIPVRVRLKGQLPDHWDEPGRMSLRVDVRKGQTIMGFSKFAIQRPSSRQYPYEQAYEKLVAAMGGLAANYNYADISVNGEKWGIWNIEEKISSEFLEKQQRKDSLTFDISAEKFFDYKYRNKEFVYDDPTYGLRNSSLFAEVKKTGKIRRNANLRQQYSLVMKQLAQDGSLNTYDGQAMVDSIALAFAWGTNHVLIGGNTRYYLNPYTLLLEPISSDQSWPHLVEKFSLAYPYDVPFRKIITSPQFPSLFEQSIQKVTQIEPKLIPFFVKELVYFPNDNYLSPEDRFKKNLWIAQKAKASIIQKIHSYLSVERWVYEPNFANPQLPNEQQLAHLEYHVHARHFTDGRVRIYNLLPLSVSLKAIRTDFDVLDQNLPSIPPHQYVDIQTGWNGIHDNAIQVTTELANKQIQQQTGLSLFPPEKIFNPTLNFTPSNKLPKFVQSKESGYVITPGQWVVHYPLVLAGPLTIQPGTEIKFAENSYLIIHGHLDAQGKEAAPISLTALKDHWKGIYVMRAKDASKWSYLKISNTQALTDGPLQLTGGVTLYKSDLHADHIDIVGTEAEDALNLAYANIDLNHVRFAQTRSDGLDLDFCHGKLSNITVEHIGGDGLDFSGSNIKLEHFAASQVKDKSLSIGEETQLQMEHLTIKQSGVGIAAKDGSQAIGQDINIAQSSLKDIMTYRKKSFYGHAKMTLSDVSVSKESGFVNQSGNQLSINGNNIRGVALDVKNLYKTSVMKK